MFFLQSKGLRRYIGKPHGATVAVAGRIDHHCFWAGPRQFTISAKVQFRPFSSLHNSPDLKPSRFPALVFHFPLSHPPSSILLQIKARKHADKGFFSSLQSLATHFTI